MAALAYDIGPLHNPSHNLIQAILTEGKGAVRARGRIHNTSFSS